MKRNAPRTTDDKVTGFGRRHEFHVSYIANPRNEEEAKRPVIVVNEGTRGVTISAVEFSLPSPRDVREFAALLADILRRIER